ncbi:MAG: flagellar hook-associated protein FlgK [Planctomycetes bacterium]|nr:flagellar hook-associated protein FlgK [Planctomycetota bacterium]
MQVFSSLNVALTGLKTQLARIQTISHNISNAQTEGYSRQDVTVESNVPHDLTRVQIGTGALLKKVRRIVNESLEKRLQSSISDKEKNSQLSSVGIQLEQAVDPLGENNLQADLSAFFDSLNALVSSPTDSSLRTLSIQSASTVADRIKDLGVKLTEMRRTLNDELKALVSEVNRFTSEIADINNEIVNAESGGIYSKSANDLRDQRGVLVTELSKLLDIKTVETGQGALNILSNGAYLVVDAASFSLGTKDEVNNQALVSKLIINSSTGFFDPKSGQIGGIIFARDGLIQTTQRDVDNLANSLIREFNKVHAEGRGTEKITELLSEKGVLNTTSALSVNGTVSKDSTKDSIISSSLIGLPDLSEREVIILSGQNILERRNIIGFDSTTGTLVLEKPLEKAMQIGDTFQISELDMSVKNGSFDIIVENNATQTISTFNIAVDLDKSVTGSTITDTTLTSLAAGITAATSSVVTASITNDGKLKLKSSSDTFSFRFANDTSGVLAGLGMNGFFTGTDASDIGINNKLLNNEALFATSADISGQDSANLQKLVNLQDANAVNGQATFQEFFGEIGQVVTSLSAKVQDKAGSSSLLVEQLQNERDKISGVNIDEEGVRLLQSQHAFIASSRLISVVDEMIRTLLTSV